MIRGKTAFSGVVVIGMEKGFFSHFLAGFHSALLWQCGAGGVVGVCQVSSGGRRDSSGLLLSFFSPSAGGLERRRSWRLTERIGAEGVFHFLTHFLFSLHPSHRFFKRKCGKRVGMCFSFKKWVRFFSFGV